MTVECHKLDFVGFPIGINMDDGADVARFEAVRRQRLGEDHSLVFFDHNGTISQWVGADQPRSLEALVDDPNASNGGVPCLQDKETGLRPHISCRGQPEQRPSHR